MRNKEIRNAMLRSNVKQWEVAEHLGISEFTICRWLRSELPSEKKESLLQAISEVKNRKESEYEK